MGAAAHDLSIIGLFMQADWIVKAYQWMRNSGYIGAAFLWNLDYNVTQPSMTVFPADPEKANGTAVMVRAVITSPS